MYYSEPTIEEFFQLQRSVKGETLNGICSYTTTTKWNLFFLILLHWPQINWLMINNNSPTYLLG